MPLMVHQDFAFDGNDDPGHVFAEYDRLRAECPVAFTNEYGGYWALTRHEDVVAAATDPGRFISSVRAVVPSDPRGIRRPPLNFDAPRHTPFRRALTRTIAPARTEVLLRELRPRAEKLFRRFVEGDDTDIARTFGTWLPAYAASLWLNLDADRVDWLADTATAWVDAWRRQNADEVTYYSEQLYDVARWLVADRGQHPRDPDRDPASALLSERVDGQPLDHEHIVGALRQSLVVGMVAPPLLIGSMAWHLATHPDLFDQLKRQVKLRGAATEEFLRLYSPYRGFARTVSERTELHGRQIEPGVPVTLVYAAANRDPEVFPDPDVLDLNRGNLRDHVAFGRGTHQCVGMHLARGTVAIALDTMLDGCVGLDLLDDPVGTRMPELGYQSVRVRVAQEY